MAKLKLFNYNAYWVVPDRFMAGEYPGNRFYEEDTPQRIEALLELGLTTSINLTMPYDCIPYEPILLERADYYQIKVQHLRFAIGDFGVPAPSKMRAILDAIQQTIDQAGKVYIHCAAGIGRTGISVGCYLVEQGMSGEDAVKEVNRLCYYANSPETAIQKEFILAWGKQK